MSKSPNFLFIITDQQRADHVGCYGNAIVRTPHIDSLAARGFRAEQCHVASPVCMPNRASLMTGRTLSRHGVRHNGIELALPYYGFETAHLSVMHADRQSEHWRRWLRSQVKDADKLIGPENAIPTPDYALTKCQQAWRTRVPEELYPNSWITDRTLDALRDFARGERPFFIHCSYPDPHQPFTPPGRYWGMYSPDHVLVPGSFSATHRDIALHLRWTYEQRDSGRAVKQTQILFGCTEREAVAIWAAKSQTTSAHVVSDELWCFRGVKIIGADHEPTVTGGDKGSARLVQFKAVNTLLGNLKTSLKGTYHAFDFAKCAHRYLAEAQCRFGRRFNLASILGRLLRAALLTTARLARLIRLTEECR